MVIRQEIARLLKGIKKYNKPRKIAKGVINILIDWKAVFLVRNTGMLYEEGWWESCRRRSPVDMKGNPIPWLTYPCLRFLEDRIDANFLVFEYGCGNSTLWWAGKVSKVISCEHDQTWFHKLSCCVPRNVEIVHRDLIYGGEYSREASKYDNYFDVIVIDGRDRVNCAKNSLGALTKKGVLIWDNTERDEYREGFEYLQTEGFKRIDFWGMGPLNTAQWCTSIFYRRDNCLGI